MIVTLTEYFRRSNISSRFWTTIMTQHTTIMVFRALLLFQVAFSLASSPDDHPKYWHSFMRRILLSSEDRKRLRPKMSISSAQKSSSLRSQVRLKMNIAMGVTNLLKTLLESTLMSSFMPRLLKSLRKSAMMRRQCMTTRKAWTFWLSMTIRTSSSERLQMHRYTRQRMQPISGDRWRGSQSQQQRQLRSSLSKRRKQRQQANMRGWKWPVETTEPKRQTSQANRIHQKATICSTLPERRAGRWLITDKYCNSAPFIAIDYIISPDPASPASCLTRVLCHQTVRPIMMKGKRQGCH